MAKLPPDVKLGTIHQVASARPRTREHARAISFCHSVGRRGSIAVVHLHPERA